MVSLQIEGKDHSAIGAIVREVTTAEPIGELSGMLVQKDGRIELFVRMATHLRPELVGFAVALERHLRAHPPDQELGIPQLLDLAGDQLVPFVGYAGGVDPGKVSEIALETAATLLQLWAKVQTVGTVKG